MISSQILAAAKREADDASLHDTLFLVKNGIPFDVAFSLPAHRRLAWVVIMGTLEGGEFDWRAGSWKAQDR